MATRAIYLIAGISAFYFAVAPNLSQMPDTRESWFTALEWLGAFGLVAAALSRNRNRACSLAAIGSTCVLFLYLQFAISRVLLHFGALHVHGRLVLGRENWFDRWRSLLDRPLLFLLFFTSLASLAVVFRSRRLRSGNVVNA